MGADGSDDARGGERSNAERQQGQGSSERAHAHRGLLIEKLDQADVEELGHADGDHLGELRRCLGRERGIGFFTFHERPPILQKFLRSLPSRPPILAIQTTEMVFGDAEVLVSLRRRPLNNHTTHATSIAIPIHSWARPPRCRDVGAHPLDSSMGRTTRSYSGTRPRMVRVPRMSTDAGGRTNEPHCGNGVKRGGRLRRKGDAVADRYSVSRTTFPSKKAPCGPCPRPAAP